MLSSNPQSVAPQVRSFIDLRSFAAELPSAERGSDDFFAGRRYLDLLPGPASVAAMRFDRSTGAVTSLDADEFVIVLDGALAIDAPNGRLTLNAGESAVLPRGSRFGWEAEAATIVIMRHESDAIGAGKPLAIDLDAELQPSNPPLAALLIGPTPSCRNNTDFKSANGEFSCGVWTSTPYHRMAMPYRHHELMHLLDGSVTFQDAAGRRATFHKGDIFLVEQGAECSWLSEVSVTKVYALYRPA